MNIGREANCSYAGIRDRKTRLIARSDHEFIFEGGDTEIVFAAGGTGTAKELILRESGTDAYLGWVK